LHDGDDIAYLMRLVMYYIILKTILQEKRSDTT